MKENAFTSPPVDGGKASYSVGPAVVRLSAVFCSEKGLSTTLNVCILHLSFSMKAKIYFSPFRPNIVNISTPALPWPTNRDSSCFLACLSADRWDWVAIHPDYCSLYSVFCIGYLSISHGKLQNMARCL